MLHIYEHKLIIRRVVARISIDVTTPLPERKFDGVFQIVTEFSPMASPAFEVGRYVLIDVVDHLRRELIKTGLPTPKSSCHAYWKRPSVARTPSTPSPCALSQALNASHYAPTCISSITTVGSSTPHA
jgi:hypothetical protein